MHLAAETIRKRVFKWRHGNWLMKRSAWIGAWCKSLGGWHESTQSASTMSGSISTFWLTSKLEKLYCHLRLQKKRRKRYGSYGRRGQLPNRVSIEERPAIVAERKRSGDWEADTIIGKRRRKAIVTLTERKTQFALLRKVDYRQLKRYGWPLLIFWNQCRIMCIPLQ